MSNNGDAIAIAAPTLFDGEQFLQDHCVILRGGSIEQVLPRAECPAGLVVEQLDEGTLAPGFIDLQVNGGGDVMLHNAPCLETVQTIQLAHRALGTTSIMPTVLSDTAEIQQAAVNAVAQARQQGNAGIAGIHIEGPYFSVAKHGAHQEDRIRSPQPADIAWLCALQPLPVMVTLAPEVVPAEYIEQLAASGILVCAGHTSASYADIASAAQRGLQGVTHLFNAMSPLTSRQPGAVGAALDMDDLWAGIIADGHHVHPASIRLAQAAKPRGRLVLVSDAMATVGGRQDSFELYGETIFEQDGRLVNAAGALAGSAIGMIDAVRYCHREVGIALAECLRMASLYPADILNRASTLGRIAAGHRADLVHFDYNLSVRGTWLAGQYMAHGQEDAALDY